MKSQDRKDYEDNKAVFFSKLPEGITVLSEYETWKKPITVRCEKCGRVHTYSEAKQAIKRRCGGCWLVKNRNASTERLTSILEACGMTLVDWPSTSEFAEIQCNKCGCVFRRKPKFVIDHKGVACQECHKAEIANRPKKAQGPTDKQLAQRAAKKAAYRQRMKVDMDDLISRYADDYDVVSVDDSYQNAILRHRLCGHEFTTTKWRMKQGYGCKICSKRGVSKAAQEIESYFKANGIVFEKEKRFDECRRLNPLPFDFYVPSKNLLIEYNGEQHYRATELFGGEKKLELYRERDAIKRQFAKAHGCRLLVIPWYEDPIPRLKCVLDGG